MTSPDRSPPARGGDVRLSARLLEILVLVARLHGLTVDQLTRLLYATSSRNWAGEQLRKLYRGRLLERELLPKTSRAGSAPYIYRLSGSGFRLLKQLEEEYDLALPDRYRRPSGPPSPFALAHDRAVADLNISALVLQRQCPEIRLVDWLHDRDLHRDPVQIDLDGQLTSVIPDAYIEFLQDGHIEYSLLAEVDQRPSRPAALAREESTDSWATCRVAITKCATASHRSRSSAWPRLERTGRSSCDAGRSGSSSGTMQWRSTTAFSSPASIRRRSIPRRTLSGADLAAALRQGLLFQ